MKKGIQSFFALFAFAVCTASCQDAQGFGGVREANIYPFIQYFRWEEFARDGDRLLKESGPQYGVGGEISLALMQVRSNALTVRGKLEVSGGVVDYDGQLQNGTPHKTEVEYIGSLGEIDIGFAIPYRNSIIEPFWGLSYRMWQRDLQGSSGYVEEWSSAATLLGVRSNYELAKGARFFVTGAAKYPFDNVNRVDYPGIGVVNLSPGSDWSVVADAGIRFRHLYASIFYENFIFPKSPVVRNLYQPRSESEIYGFRIGYAFR